MRTFSDVLLVLAVITTAVRKESDNDTEDVMEHDEDTRSEAVANSSRGEWGSYDYGGYGGSNYGGYGGYGGSEYSVGMHAYNVSSLYSPTGVLVWYPTTPGSYPFVSFAHGLGDGGEGLQNQVGGICRALAAKGLIVAAHQSCSMGCFSHIPFLNVPNPLSAAWARLGRTRGADFSGFKYYYYEQTKVIDWAKGYQGVFPGLPQGVRADFSNGVGVAGHSMGGQATGYSASSEGHPDIRAAVLMHPYSTQPMTPIKPFLILTSRYDQTAKFPMSQAIYNAGTASEKALVDIPGMSHVAIRTHVPTYSRFAAAWLLRKLKPYSSGSSETTLSDMRSQYDVQAQGW
eukprot:TRINITY_DN9744_c0_g1_i2.p1 TRINITY_DN9744_c0_g1~~TRINITY_DN9744_c0_g1_i2.p1  ORF type:complete len:344 (-),score=54.26 TRINITY_DN9744_c0_g1_i2:328-1359(-)